jgi:magnesium-transporting ATPase (P-type)
MHFHQLTEKQVFEKLQATAQGLSQAEATRRLEKYGYNRLPASKKLNLAMIILHQFKSPLIYILLLAAVISVVVGEWIDAVFIGIVLFVNALIGTLQEWNAEKNASALQQMVRIKAKVWRDGQAALLDAEALVPGDWVALESGVKVPADMRLLQSHHLSIEEALLTGESMPIFKQTEAIEEAEIPIGDRKNMAYAGTTVIHGRALGLVVATGLQTEIGKIAENIQSTQEAITPLMQKMERFTQKLSWMVLLASLLIFAIGVWEGHELLYMFLVVVAMAVSAIPEGLPVGMTIALSIGSMRMAKRNVIIRKLAAVEGLGSCTYIASDKTGTLTVDQQTLRQVLLPDGRLWQLSGEGYNGIGEIRDTQGHLINSEARNIVEAAVLCNEAILKKNTLGEQWEYQGDAIDVALLALAYKAGFVPEDFQDKAHVLKEIPFEPTLKYAGVYYEIEGLQKAAFKGAFEALAPALQNTAQAEAMQQEVERLAAQGFRVIALAQALAAPSEGDALPPLELLALLALIDPIKPEAQSAIALCRQAGIEVAMVTGDHPATALAIARELGIAHTEAEVIQGKEMPDYNAAKPEEFIRIVEQKKVFARVSPLQKQQIVEALKKIGHFVAVTGDGVNDAPALKSANIGVAMGYGTDVAKEAASIIVTDNNFSSIAAGVEEGRYTYSNIRKMIYLLVSCGIAEIMIILLALIFNLPIPLLANQLLWLNLVTNGVQDVALAFEKGEKSVMKVQAHAMSKNIFDKIMVQSLVVSSLTIGLISFGLWYHLLENLGYAEEQARNIVLLLMVLLQNYHTFNARSERHSTFTIPLHYNWVLVGGVVLAHLLHIGAMCMPFAQKILKISPVSFDEWLKVFATAASILVVMELFKLGRKLLPKAQPHSRQ